MVAIQIDTGRIDNIILCIFMPVKAAVEDFRFKLEINVELPDGLSKSIIENTIKETIRQIGAEIDNERLD